MNRGKNNHAVPAAAVSIRIFCELSALETMQPKNYWKDDFNEFSLYFITICSDKWKIPAQRLFLSSAHIPIQSPDCVGSQFLYLAVYLWFIPLGLTAGR